MHFFSTNSHGRKVSKGAPRRVRRGTAPAFWLGLFAGFAATITLGAATVYGVARYMAAQTDQSAVFASSPATTTTDNRVQMYFPLERFLTWRSTTSTEMSMQGDQVRVQFYARPFPAIGLTFGVDIYGTPAVIHGDFALRNVSGYLDHIPLPKSLVLGAIASGAQQYGVHVNAAHDTLYVVKKLGDYRLIGYDAKAHDLVLSLPVSAVEEAAGHQAIM